MTRHEPTDPDSFNALDGDTKIPEPETTHERIVIVSKR